MTIRINWLLEAPFTRKAVVVVEDHTYHFEEMLRALGGGLWPAQMTAVCLDRPGPDTTASVISWLQAHPGLQVATRFEPGRLGELAQVDRARLLVLPEAVFGNQHRFCKTVAGLVRPGGLLVQDIQLETLSFIGEEDWWETIFLASTVRGLLAENPPACRFMSNKSGFGISFGKELMEAGFDPRDVFDKNDLTGMIDVVLDDFMGDTFPLKLEMALGEEEPRVERVGPGDLSLLAETLDLLWWEDANGMTLAGRILARPLGHGGSGRPGAQEWATWLALVSDRLDAGSGLSVDEVGARVSAAGSLKAERSNVAARHLHTLRGRLKDAAAIVTSEGRYALAMGLRVGRVRLA